MEGQSQGGDTYVFVDVRRESCISTFKVQLLKQTLKVGVSVQGFYAKLLKRSFHNFESEYEVADSLLKCSCCLL